MVDHAFGGIWTEIKLNVLDGYIKAYVTALKKQKFILHYADAFAGTGSRQAKDADAGAYLIPLEDMKGSAQLALETAGFNHYHFNDLSPRHREALEALAHEHPSKSVTVTQMDANDFIEDFCAKLGTYDRAVLFVDPYATEMTWRTIQSVAFTRQIDLWLLFPFASLNRIIPRHGAKPEWEEKITAMLGDAEWKEHAYRPREAPVLQDMFESECEVEGEKEKVNQEALTHYITERLRSVFDYTSEPLRLKNSKNSTLFLLYFSMAGRSQKARDLGERISRGVLKKSLLSG